MSEFAENVRAEAGAALRNLYGQEPSANIDPIIELIGYLTEESATTEPCSAWNQLAMDQPEHLSTAITAVLERERVNLPTTEERLRPWANWLIQTAIDWNEME